MIRKYPAGGMFVFQYFDFRHVPALELRLSLRYFYTTNTQTLVLISVIYIGPVKRPPPPATIQYFYYPLVGQTTPHTVAKSPNHDGLLQIRSLVLSVWCGDDSKHGFAECE